MPLSNHPGYREKIQKIHKIWNELQQTSGNTLN
jgi:hypothetical protein